MGNFDVIVTKEADRMSAAGFLLKRKGIRVLIVEDSTEKIREYICHYEPACLVLPEYSDKNSAIDVMQELRQSDCLYGTAVAVVADYADAPEKYYHAKCGVNFFFTIDVGIEKIADVIGGIVKSQNAIRLGDYGCLRMAEIVLEDHFVPKYAQGYGFLCNAIRVCVEKDLHRINLSEDVMPEITEYCEISEFDVERSMHSAIKLAYNTATEKGDLINKAFLFKKGLPTNRDFILNAAASIMRRKMTNLDA